MIPGSCFTGKSLQVMEGGAAFNDGRISVGDRLVVVKNRQANKQTLIFSIFQAGRRQEPAHWRLLLGQLHPRGGSQRSQKMQGKSEFIQGSLATVSHFTMCQDLISDS